ncbi:MAG TPA: trehalose-6-phosphate synthase [Thermoanaerobaculia bacterium]|nr:trehalose-6-phosphate synthase [Thermoanaerobaculia bacterium]
MVKPRRLIVVSNRLPVVLQKLPEGEWKLKPGSGGLVSALAPVLSHRGGLWIGWPGLAVEPGGPWEKVLEEGFRERGYDLVPVVLTDDEVQGFYYGFSNSVLWPLFHDMASSCDFDPAFWYSYLQVNRKFGQQVVEHTRPDDFIWIQDYQLINVAEAVREQREDRRLGFFLHIPFPPLDIFLKMPWRGQILAALLAYDLIGFQTPRDLRNFLSCLSQLLPDIERIEEQPGLVKLRVGDREVQAGAFPIGIDAKDFSDFAQEPETDRRLEDLRGKIGPWEVVLGVDRLDYTKGLPERFLAFADALERYPDLRERVILLQQVVPSRENVPEYQALKARLDGMVGEINGRFSTAGWMPIHYHYRSLPRRDLVCLYRMSRVGFVTSIKDGMNLVSKEYCACQVDCTGALVLSEFAGAAAQLESGALLVNPHDIEGMADALHRAVELGEDERRRRMEAMRQVIFEQDIFWWVDRFLSVALDTRLADLTPPPDYTPEIETGDSWVDV